MSSPAAPAGQVMRFNCQICGATCGMLATVEDDRIVSVAGDRDHPVSGGYTCAKGRAIATLQYSPRRLDRPQLHGEEVPWDAFLDDLAENLERVRKEGGPNRIARYGGQGFIDAASWFADKRLLEGIGTTQVYASRTLDIAPPFKAAELVTGFSNFHPAWTPDDPTPTLAVLIGVNPPMSSGYLGSVSSNWTQRLRGFRRRGGELWVVDPRETKTARQADRHLAPRSGTDVFLLAWIVRELLEQGFDADELERACEPADVERLRAAVAPFDLQTVAERTCLPASDLVDLIAAIRRHGKLAIMSGTGVSFQASGVLVNWLIWATMIVTGSLDREGGLRFLAPGRGALDAPPLEGHAPEGGLYGPGPVSRPDLDSVFGQQPAVALVDEIEAGEVRALLVLGGNLLGNVPDPDRWRAALATLDVLAVFDILDTELTRMATHVIPCAWFTERNEFRFLPWSGMLRSYWSPALVPPGGERRNMWWVLAQVGSRLGVDALDGLDPDTVDDETVLRHVAHTSCDFADEVIDAGPYGVENVSRYGWFHEKVLPGGRWRLAPTVLVDRLAGVWSDGSSNEGIRLVCGRIPNSINTIAYAALDAGPPPMHVSADAAGQEGIATGDTIRVSTSFGAIEGLAQVDETMAPGSIWVSQGWLEQNVNRILDRAADRMTGQPVFTGIPVRLERVGSPSAG